MFFSLSGFVRARLEQTYDGKIPARETAELRVVENWERVNRNEIGQVESARLTLHHANLELSDRAAEYALRRRIAQLPGQDPIAREALVVARGELIGALDWVDQCTLQYRNALRKEAGQW